MKTCSSCQTEKPFSDFHKRSSAKDGHQPQCKDCRRGWSERDREKNAARSKKWHESNKESQREYRIRNREHRAELYNVWAHNNPDRIAMKSRRQRARRKGAMTESIAVSDSFIKNFYGNRCLDSDCSATTKLQLDHVIPLNRGGAHTLENLQVLCGHHNASKGDRSCADYRTVKLVAVDPVSMTIVVQSAN